jgi:tryptophan halogenase
MMTEFLNSIGIDLFDFLKKTGGTIKHAISFENWNGDGKKYLHPFYENLVEFSIPGMFGHSCFDFYNKKLISENLPFSDYLYQSRLSEQNKIDLKNTTFALHFNTYKFGEYLKNFSKVKNIDIIIGEYKNSILNTKGEIVQISLEDGQLIDCDFIFDCSGFSRLLIKDVYNSEWISYRPHLPMKKAIAFWLDPEEKIPPYTSAIAMKYGWMWKIPLQDRFGCGYVYDSDYIDEFQAQAEAEEFYNRKLDVRRVIDIDAGRYKNVWVKNCIAVGLSGNFIEPLESTSIWLELALMFNLKHFANEIDKPSEDGISLFNQIIGNEVDEKMNFVYLHYMTKRSDSEFWKEFKQKNIMPEKIKKLWPYIINNNLRYYQINDSMCPAKFPLMSYLWISSGLELIENKGNFDCYNIDPTPEIYRSIIDIQIDSAADQKQFLSNL